MSALTQKSSYSPFSKGRVMSKDLSCLLNVGRGIRNPQRLSRKHGCRRRRRGVARNSVSFESFTFMAFECRAPANSSCVF